MTSSPLQTLRSRLTALRTARAWSRAVAALSLAVVIAVWLLGAVFLIDFLLEREIRSLQRAVLTGLAAVACLWLWKRLVWPLLAIEETETDLALQVERHYQLENDLVAALQFDLDTQGRLGSRALERAVVDGVAQAELDIPSALPSGSLGRHALLAGCTLAIVAVLAGLYPRHFEAFLSRLALRGGHYPGATNMAAIHIAGRTVELAGERPRELRLPEGVPLEFLVTVQGRLPPLGLVHLASITGASSSQLELKPLDKDARQQRLEAALEQIRAGRASHDIDLAGTWLDELQRRVRPELPDFWHGIQQRIGTASAGQRGELLAAALPEMESELATAIEGWSRNANRTALLSGSLPRLVEPIEYRLTAGDAYTDPGLIAMIPLPVVEPRVNPEPPAYAAKMLKAANVGRQSAVLAGSTIGVQLACTNGKSLREAWITVRSGDQLSRFDLKSENENRTLWSLASPNTPFQQVSEDLRYEMQVTDDDGLHLETPIQGTVRLRADKPPVVSAATIHHVVLPGARPRVQIRAGDDFGLRSLAFEITVRRQGAVEPDSKTASSPTAANATEEDHPPETARLVIQPERGVILPGDLPLSQKVELELKRLGPLLSQGALQKGDRLEIVLAAEDYRGEAPGEIARSEPFTLDISDEFGVASAVSEVDPQAEERINDIIKRQLGIGESP